MIWTISQIYLMIPHESQTFMLSESNNKNFMLRFRNFSAFQLVCFQGMKADEMKVVR